MAALCEDRERVQYSVDLLINLLLKETKLNRIEMNWIERPGKWAKEKEREKITKQEERRKGKDTMKEDIIGSLLSLLKLNARKY